MWSAIIFFTALLASFHVHAACIAPGGEAGTIIFNADHKVMQYCNGDDWVGLWGGGGGTGGGGGVPAGAVMAFNLTTCPSGWSEYTPARGRFIRGIDNGAGNDPDGTRTSGSVQVDALGNHNHTATAASAGAHTHTGTTASAGAHTHTMDNVGNLNTDVKTDNNGGSPSVRYNYNGATNSAGAHTHTFTTGSAGAHTHSLTIEATGDAETRPKNVALLYCEKQ